MQLFSTSIVHFYDSSFYVLVLYFHLMNEILFPIKENI